MLAKKLLLVCLTLLGLGILFVVPASADSVIQGTPVSCYEILLNGNSTGDGVYTIDPDGAGGEAPVDVYCDMTTDGGGWTLVGSSRTTTFNDQASLYYTDLITLTPSAGHGGIWDGMRPVAWHEQSDMRFSCRVDPDASGPFDVDLAFYEVPWYEEITASADDADVCFEESDGDGQTLPPPARQNLLTGETRPLGDQWDSGYLEGEDDCDDTGDFTVDFDDRGMDSDQSDGTDWGEDDSSSKCGVSYLSDGAWFVWVREPAGVFLDPERVQGGDMPGETVVYTFTLHNLTGVVDSFDLTLTGNNWPTSLSIANTGPISNSASLDFTVSVEIPAGSGGSYDDVSVVATSVLRPTGFVATADLRTYAFSGQVGYVFSSDVDEIHLVDTVAHVDTGITIDTSPYGSWPWEGAISPDGQWLYTTSYYSSVVVVVDTATHTPVISIAVGDVPREVTFSADGAYAFVTNRSSDNVSVIDTAQLTVTATIPVGYGPQAIAASPCLDKIYVANRLDYSISVIDVDTLAVIETISGFSDPLFDLVISPYGHRAYATDQWSGTIHVIDTLSDTWIDTWYVGASSQNALALSLDGRVLYMTSNDDGIVYALDAFTGALLRTIIVGPGYSNARTGWDIEIFPDEMGDFAYVSLPGMDEIAVLDTATNEKVGAFSVEGGPRGLALFPPASACLSGVLLDPPHAVQSGFPGDSVVYTQTLHNLTGATDSFALSANAAWPTSLSLADTGSLDAGDSITFTVQVDVPPDAQVTDYDIAVVGTQSNSNPAVGAEAHLKTAVPRPGFVFDADLDLIRVVDTAAHVDTGISIDTTPYGEFPFAGELSPDGTQLYVSLRDSASVLVVDTATLTPVLAIPVGNLPFEIAFRSDGRYAFVANRDINTVSVIDTAQQVVTATIPVGSGPQGVAASPCLDKVYVTTRWDYEVYVLDSINLTVTTVITGFTDQLFDIVISPLGDRAYVTNHWEYEVHVIDTATDTWIDTFYVPVSYPSESSIESIDLSPNGQVLYITSNRGGRTYALDAFTGDLLGEFGTGPSDDMQGSWQVEVFPWWAGPYAYVSSPLFWWDVLGDVKVLNLETGQVVGNIQLGGGPRGMALFPPADTCGALPSADFVPALSTIQVGESITFTSSISGYPAPDLTWDFGDGTPLSNEAHPVHPFLTEGVFEVTLLAENIFDQVVVTGVVTAYLPVNADFSPLDGKAVAGQGFAFTNLSSGTGPLVYTWDFGDGSPLSSEVNPVHVYTAVGSYTVTLTVDGPYGQDTVTGVVEVVLRQYLPVIQR